jgi:hypothetical protein
MTDDNAPPKMLPNQRHREQRRLFFAEMLGSNACTVTPFGRTVDVKFPPVLRRES